MKVAHVDILVEERSMEVTLLSVLPKIWGNLPFAVNVFQGRGDLLAKLPARLRGYKRWLPDDYRIVVIVDRDSDDCKALKARLESAASRAGLATRSMASDQFAVVNRIAVEELEAWYFGDWPAVRAAYPRVRAGIPRKEAYRHPDAIAGGTAEAFERVMRDAGHFVSGLRKIEAARAIAPHMVPARNASPSFCALRDVLATFAA